MVFLNLTFLKVLPETNKICPYFIKLFCEVKSRFRHFIFEKNTKQILILNFLLPIVLWCKNKVPANF